MSSSRERNEVVGWLDCVVGGVDEAGCEVGSEVGVGSSEVRSGSSFGSVIILVG